MPLQYNDNREANRGTQDVEGTFFLNGAGAIDNTQNLGRNFTATRTGVGTATVKINIPAKACLHFAFELSKAAILNRLLHVLGRVQGADGMWTYTLALTDLNNAGVAATEWAAAAATAFVTFGGKLQLGNS